MRRALDLAHRGPAIDANPQVGCVILDPESRIIAEGWHRGSGTAHAETDALARVPHEWRDRMRELTAVVTLEPCNHTGRTGPCARALVESGIASVVFALHDPGVMSSGGEHVLRDAGIAVESGVLAGAARMLLAPWFARHAAAGGDELPARPRVTVKWAQTLDGRAAAADGSSQWITGAAARADVHRQRAAADAILVGTGTLLSDDPALTARDAAGDFLVPAEEQPIPVVLGHREIPEHARVRTHPALAAHGMGAPIQLHGEDLAADLASLHARGIRSLFVEGGPTVASAFIASGLADELLVYVAPALLGGERLAIGDLGIDSIDGILRATDAQITRLGDDLRLTAALTTSPTAPRSEEQH